MAHGQPDFGLYTQKKTTYGLADSGELAARLGSIVTYDRRGDVVWLDNFEAPSLRWVPIPLGTNPKIVLTSVTARSLEQSVLIQPGDAVDNDSSITRYFPIFVPSKLGIEISFTVPALSMEFHIDALWHDGTYVHNSIVRYIRTGNIVQYFDSGGLPVYIATQKLRESMFCFHTMKLVVDFNTMTYERLQIDDQAYDLTGIALQPVLDPIAQSVTVTFRVRNLMGAVVPVSYVDDFILTQNEF